MSDKIFKLLLVFIFCISLVSAVAPTFRSDLSDTFSNSNFDLTKFNYTSVTGTSGFCGLNTNTFAETTYLRRTAEFNGISGIAECYSYQNTFSIFNFNTGNDLKVYDIYINKSTNYSYCNPGFQGDAHTQSIVLYNTKFGTQTSKMLTYTNSTNAYSVWHLKVKTALETVDTYYPNGTLANSSDLSGFSNWYIGFEELVHGQSDNGCIKVESLVYNYAVYESNETVVEDTIGYSSNIYETSTQTITSSIFWDNETFNNVNAQLFYDDVPHSTTKTISGNQANFSVTFDTPSVSYTRDLDFYFNYSLDGINIIGDTNQQEVNKTYFNICNDTYTTAYVNFTAKEEGSLLEMNASFNMVVNYWLGTGTTYALDSYSNLNNNQSRFNFCFNPSDRNVTVSAVIDYSYTDPVTNESWPTRSYYLDSAILTNAGQSISLFLLTDASSTPVNFQVVDQNYAPVPYSFIRILRYDYDTTDFYATSMIKTDINGKGVGLVRLYDAYYKYQVIVDGKLVLTTSPAIESETTRVLQISVTPTSPYNLFSNISYSFDYDNETQSYLFVWADTSGNVATGCLSIWSFDMNNGSNRLSYVCLSSSSGSLSYTLTQNGTYVGDAIFILTEDNQNVEQIIESIMTTIGMPSRFLVIGSYGQVAGLLLIGTLGMIGVASGNIILALFLIFAGIIVAYMIGLLYFSPTIMITLACILIIFAFAARRRLG